MRKLVTIRKIADVQPIPGADAIECAVIDGWKVVVKKNEFERGELCVYFEIDSFLPTGNPGWQFLVDKSSRVFEEQRGHVLRTVKLRGQVSQGLALKISDFALLDLTIRFDSSQEAIDALEDDARAEVKHLRFGMFEHEAQLSPMDLDFAKLLGVKKYEAPIPTSLAGVVKDAFPSFIFKTDQERIQNVPYVLEDTSAEYEITMKLDGSSMTVYAKDGYPGVCSRNLELKLGEENAENTFVRTATSTKLIDAIVATGRNIAVQGELMGPGIQGNPEKLKQHKFFVFNIFDIDEYRYLTPSERMEIYLQIHDYTDGAVKHAPVISSCFKMSDVPGGPTMQNILKFAEGKSIVGLVREGLVFKRLDGNASFKVISNQFLLGQKE